VVAERLGLQPADVEHSREVLRTNGNCSSATVLLILDRIVGSGAVDAGQYMVAMAFGPGLTLYASLLRAR
jgi:predicted naringenin-chalcone synthase